MIFTRDPCHSQRCFVNRLAHFRTSERFAGQRSARNSRLRGPFARNKQTLNSAAAVLAAFHARYSAGEIDDELVAAQHVLTLRHHHFAGERHSIAGHIENSELPGRGLILRRDDDAAARLEPLDLLLAARSRISRPHHFGRLLVRALIVLIVEDDQRLALHGRIALLHAYIAAESRDLVLVTHFQARRLDMDRLIPVLGEALQRVRRTFRALRTGQSGCGQEEPNGQAAESQRPHFASASRCSCVCGGGSLKVIATPPVKRTTSPESAISSRFASSVPCIILSCTGSLETTCPS